MKRLSWEAKQRLLRRQFERERQLRKARSKRLKKQRQRARKASIAPALRVNAPAVFSIESDVDRPAVLAFLSQLRLVYANAVTGSTLVIDFTRTHRFIAHGTLLLYAELTRLIEYGAGRIRLRCTLAANTRANQVLQQIGLFAVCGQNIKFETTLSDVVHWRVARGHLVDGRITAPAIEVYEGQMAGPLVDGILRGLGEAMTNVKHHAYIQVRQDNLNFTPAKQDWWMFSQERNGVLSVVFCDLLSIT